MENTTWNSKHEAPVRRPYPVVIALATKVMEDRGNDGFTQFDLAGWAVGRTLGLPYFCPCDVLYKSRLAEMERLPGFDRAEFLSILRVPGGPNKGQIPKFQHMPDFSELMRKTGKLESFSPTQRIVLECRLGMLMAPAYRIVYPYTVDMWLMVITAYGSSGECQLNWLRSELFHQLNMSNFDKITAYEELLRQWREPNYKDLARRYDGLSRHFKQVWENAHTERNNG